MTPVYILITTTLLPAAALPAYMVNTT